VPHGAPHGAACRSVRCRTVPQFGGRFLKPVLFFWGAKEKNRFQTSKEKKAPDGCLRVVQGHPAHLVDTRILCFRCRCVSPRAALCGCFAAPAAG